MSNFTHIRNNIIIIIVLRLPIISFSAVTSAINGNDDDDDHLALPITYGSNVSIPLQDLSYYRQPDDILDGVHDFSVVANSIVCARNCTLYPQPRICYFKFIVEQYHTLGPACDGCPQNVDACFNDDCVMADGIEKPVLTINRRIPGPAIVVCEGDRLVVDVENRTPDRHLSIHWHGMRQQGTPYMDGTSYVSQCPITKNQIFRYDFPATTSGTMLYHSHEAAQMLDGLQGPLIVQTAVASDPYLSVGDYDYDVFSHVIHIQDWIHVPSGEKLPGYNKLNRLTGMRPNSYLINGYGSFIKDDGSNSGMPLVVYSVRAGSTYRFRVIAGTNLPAPCLLQIESHDFRLIAVDGYYVQAVTAATLMIFSGERYDILIKADQPKTSSSTYWIRIQGMHDASKAFQLALLKYTYDDAPSVTNSSNTANSSSSLGTNQSRHQIIVLPNTNSKLPIRLPILNDVTGNCDAIKNRSKICVDQLRLLVAGPPIIFKPEPDHRLFLTAGYHWYTPEELYQPDVYHRFYLPFAGPTLDGGMFSDMYNNVSNVLPGFCLLTDDRPIPSNLACSVDRFENGFIECLHYYKVQTGSVLEIVLIDDTVGYGGEFFHPHHIHGNAFYVLKQGGSKDRLANRLFYRDAAIDRLSPDDELYRYPIKDTIAVPTGGYAVLRLLASNPGVWMFHCHNTIHLQNGMSCLIQVGDRNEFPKPPDGFPMCGNFLPALRVD